MRIDDRILNETVELTRALIRIPSVNPPGGENLIADFVQDVLKKGGIDSTRVPLAEGRSSVVARIRGNGEGSIVLCGHLDTVRADEREWSHLPFAAELEGDRIYGLGAADMKSGVAVIIQIAREIVRQGIALEHDLVLALTADEENAYRGAATVAESGLIDDARFLFILEPTAGKGYIGQKGELWVEATFTGRAAHGSVPELGVNAITPAARFVLSLQEEAENWEAVPGRGRTTLNVGAIHGGVQVNIVPAQVRVRIDSRTISTEARDEVLAAIERLGNEAARAVGAGFSLEVINDKAPIVSDPADPRVQRFLRAVYPGRNIEPEIAPYSTDAVAIVPVLGIPVGIYGPGSIAQAHQPDEYVEVHSIRAALQTIGRFISGE